jgi:hypothetical protein
MTRNVGALRVVAADFVLADVRLPDHLRPRGLFQLRQHMLGVKCTKPLAPNTVGTQGLVASINHRFERGEVHD